MRAVGGWDVDKGGGGGEKGVGFGAFEDRTDEVLNRPWLCSRMTMYFLAAQTQRRRGEKSADHAGAGSRRGQYVGRENLEPVAAIVA